MTNTITAPTPTTPTTPAAAAPAAAAPAAPARKRVNLGGIAKKKEDASNKYPILPDAEGKAAELAARIASRQEQFDALESALEIDKAELARVLVRPWYLRHFHKKADIPSSVLIQYTRDSTQTPPVTAFARVTIQDRYYGFPTDEAFRPALGDLTDTLIRQSFELKIKGDKLPEDKAGELVERIQALFAEFGCSDALEAKELFVPVTDFKSRRFSELTPEQNLALENLGEKGLTYTTVSTKNVRR